MAEIGRIKLDAPFIDWTEDKKLELDVLSFFFWLKFLPSLNHKNRLISMAI